MRRKFQSRRDGEFPEGEFSSPEDFKSKGPHGALPRGRFITCCEEEKLEGLEEGKAFHIRNGSMVINT